MNHFNSLYPVLVSGTRSCRPLVSHVHFFECDLLGWSAFVVVFEHWIAYPSEAATWSDRNGMGSGEGARLCSMCSGTRPSWPRNLRFPSKNQNHPGNCSLGLAALSPTSTFLISPVFEKQCVFPEHWQRAVATGSHSDCWNLTLGFSSFHWSKCNRRYKKEWTFMK